MNRLIDADTVVTIQVYDDVTEVTDTKKMTIAEAIDEWSDEGCPPTIDAVEVVRCKDCKCGEPNGRYGCKVYHYKLYETHEMSPTDFCSWGERRDDENL